MLTRDGIVARIVWVAALGVALTQAPLAGSARAGSPELCGNGVIDALEPCYDNNETDTDGCFLETQEQCDDGNRTEGDGCTALCRIRLCRAAPASGCIAAREASLSVRQKFTKKKDVATFKMSLSDFAEEVTPLDFGDPVFDTTRYDVCLYDQNDHLAAQLIVDRGFGTCGAPNSPIRTCWKPIRDEGYRYRDPELLSSGVASMLLLAGVEEKGRIQVDGRRTNASKDLPRITGYLVGHARATVQFMVGNGRCIEASLDDVSLAEENRFRARSEPAAP